jgi:hypothetical protein
VAASVGARMGGPTIAKGLVLGWPKRCKLARAFRWECSDKRLRLAQLLAQLRPTHGPPGLARAQLRAVRRRQPGAARGRRQPVVPTRRLEFSATLPQNIGVFHSMNFKLSTRSGKLQTHRSHRSARGRARQRGRPFATSCAGAS